MIIEKLTRYDYRPGQDMERGEGGRLIRTCRADLVYYAVLKAAVEVYGKEGVRRQNKDGTAYYEGSGRDIGLYNTDVLGIARDQMAMMASDRGLLRYGRDGLVEEITAPGRTETERMANFARESFRNSEGIYNLISKHLSGLHDYPDADARNAAVERAIDEALADGSPVMSRIQSAIDNMYDTMGETRQKNRTDVYAMQRRAEEVVPESEGGSGRKRAIPGTRPVLKLSPLMPEFRTLRLSGQGTALGLYPSQAAGVENRTHNAVLAYDFEKKMLSLAAADYKYDGEAKKDFTNGISLGRSEFGLEDGAPMQFTGAATRRVTEGLEHRGEQVIPGRRLPFYDTSVVNSGAARMQAWRMAELVRKYSQQQLTRNDYQVIQDIFTRKSGTTLFGDAFADPEGTRRNEDAYFAYIEHVCATVRDRMGSHEFEIHFSRQDYFRSEDDRGAFVPLMWFTGERTDDYDRARANPARYFGFYPYVDYTPANISSTPLFGDIAPAAYNSYTVTSGTHRRGSDTINDAATNPYAHVGLIDRDRCAELTRMFDGYMGIRSAQDLEIAKVTRPVGAEAARITDMAQFVNDDGSVDGEAIAAKLVADMRAVKAYQSTALRQPLQAARMRSVLVRFAGLMDVQHNDSAERSAANAVIRFLLDQNREEGAPAGPDKEARDALGLTRKLERAVRLEIDSAYGKDAASALAAKHVFDQFVARFAQDCAHEFHAVRNRYLEFGARPDGTELVARIEEAARTMQGGFTQPVDENPYGNIIRRSMDALFGSELGDGRVVIHANACRALSRHFMTSEYNDLLRMLSYSNAAAYEPSAMKGIHDAERDLAAGGARCLIQRYTPEAYDVTRGVADDADADEEEREAQEERRTVLAEERAWFDATFAATTAPEGTVERTLAWLDRDWSLSEDQVEAYGGSLSVDADPDDPMYHAVFEATHPLQCAALRLAGRRLRQSVGAGFDPSRLAVSAQGTIYYKNADGQTVFKAGPVTDEVGFIRPYTWPATEQDVADGLTVEIEVPETDAEGRILHDEKGKARTKTVTRAASKGLFIGADGALMNPVEFGPLDTPSISAPGQAADVVANRYYGLSAKIASYDGYDHAGQSFSERAGVTGYQNLVLENLDRALSMYGISRTSAKLPSGMLMLDGKRSMSIYYTSTGAGSLRKCYQTNTLIIEEKEKCAVGNAFMDAYTTGGAEGFAPQAEMVADLLMAQSRSYHNMVSFPKITIDQNIGLYNQGISLQQALVADMEDNLDRENLRNNDCLSARVSYAQPSAMYDVTDTGTAKNLGAKAFLSDVASFDWRTREVTVDQSPEDLAGTNTRQAFNAVGITSFAHGGIAMRPVEYPDGQPVDRLQLANNGMHKGVMYAKDVRFAMVNLGYNMEDGYIVAGRAAHKFGHFDGDTFVDAQLWDKIGDTESGNKGVIAKIVDTETGYGLPDAEAEDEFLARFTYEFLKTHGFNHGSCGEQSLSRDVLDALDEFAQENGAGRPLFRDYLEQQSCENGNTVLTEYGNLKKLLSAKYALEKSGQPVWKSVDADIEDSRRQLREGLKGACLAAGNYLMAAGAEPFAGNYRLERSLWRMFRDNPELDVAVTNVCVCTRSNPSLLMHLAQDMDSPGGTLVTRAADGSRVEVPGAMGTMNVYVDSHTADSKNIDYTTGESSRAGRNLGAQEDYALDAKKAGEGLLAYLLENDGTMPDRIGTLNRKLLMNGYTLSMEPDDGSDGFEPFRMRYVSDALDGLALDGGKNGVYVPEDKDGPLGPYGFVDMDAFGRQIAEMAVAANADLSKDALEKAMADLGELSFSRLLAPAGTEESVGAADDMLHRMFEASFARYGGSFMLLPDGLKDCFVGAGVPLNGMVYAKGGTDAETGQETYDERSAVPLFLSSHETTNSESELVASHIDDKYQFQAFKAALAASVIGYLKETELGAAGRKYLSADVASAAEAAVAEKFRNAYKDMQGQKSLSLDGMNNWMKKNIFKATNSKSLTCVWSGDPTMEIDEAGISFDKAKALGLLRLREGMEDVPDTFECMAERYEPLTDDDVILVNRSPGQTTGCIRAFRVRIVSAHGDGMKINPAAASIFDGDFDGDTVGGNNVLHVDGLKRDDPDYARKLEAAKRDMRTRLSMAGSILEKASYEKKPVLPDGTVHEAADMHGLFIAGNADFAQAKRNMKAGGACGYDLDMEFSRITCMANIVEQVRQCAYDLQNRDRGHIKEDACRDIVRARLSLVQDLAGHFGAEPGPDATARDLENGRFWKGRQGVMDGLVGALPKAADVLPTARDADGNIAASEKPLSFAVDMKAVELLEQGVSRRIKALYREMAGYITAPPMAVHGSCHHEIMASVVEGANACKKGKLPQLNALLKFSGVHAECTAGVTEDSPKPRLRIVDEGGRFKLEYGHTSVSGKDAHGRPTYKFEPCEPPEGGFDPEIKMSNIENASDVKATRFRTKEIVNLVAQSDKSDATGLGGTLAQRLQMLMAPFGYGEVALRVSGPITQRYLDAKQNVLDCETNLTIGKSILTPVYHFRRVKELSDDYFSSHTRDQAYNGSFTVLSEPLTVDEGVAQMDNFLELMGHPRMSAIDKAQFRAVLDEHADSEGKLTKILSRSEPRMDVPYNLGYRIMYGGAQSLPGMIQGMAMDQVGLYRGTCYNKAASGCARLARDGIADKTREQLKDASPSRIVSEYMEEARGASKDKTADKVRTASHEKFVRVSEPARQAQSEEPGAERQPKQAGAWTMAKMTASLAASDGDDEEEEDLSEETAPAGNTVPGE